VNAEGRKKESDGLFLLKLNTSSCLGWKGKGKGEGEKGNEGGGVS